VHLGMVLHHYWLAEASLQQLGAVSPPDGLRSWKWSPQILGLILTTTACERSRDETVRMLC
jgi:hypothetical protein